MSEIFISHAVADKPLAELFTRFLKKAIGVPTDSIFCSSIPGHGVPLTSDFNAYMRDKIQQPKLVILLMTPAYMESAFCLMELGAAWAKSHRTLPIVVPPVPFSEVTRTLGLVQAWKIEDHGGLIALRTTIIEAGIILEKRNEHEWDSKRTEWRMQSKKTIAQLSGRTSVPSTEHTTTLTELDALKAENADLERQLETAAENLEKISNAANREEVKEILRQSSGEAGISEEFQQLLDNVAAALPAVGSVVRTHIVMDHYGKAGRIDWFNDRPDFEYAIKRNYIGSDEGNAVPWNGPKLKELRSALSAVDRFMNEEDHDGFIASRTEDGVPMQTDDLEFWENHLNL